MKVDGCLTLTTAGAADHRHYVLTAGPFFDDASAECAIVLVWDTFTQRRYRETCEAAAGQVVSGRCALRPHGEAC